MLQLTDELNMKLLQKIRNQTKAAAGDSYVGHPGEAVIDRMIDKYDRPSRLEGRGFYEYVDGKRVGLWKGLQEAFPPVEDPSTISLKDLEERMLFAESIETVKVMDEGVLESVADANIGSIFGIGFPAWTGGVLQYINGYEGGLAGFVARARDSPKSTASGSNPRPHWSRRHSTASCISTASPSWPSPNRINDIERRRPVVGAVRIANQ